jgi:hypothetical protein
VGDAPSGAVPSPALPRAELARRRVEGETIMKFWVVTCREAARLVSGSLDRELSWPDRVGLRIHLFYCRACNRYAKQVAYLRDAVKQLVVMTEEGGGPGAAATLPDEARGRMKDALRKSQNG